MSFRIARRSTFVANGFRTALRQQLVRAIRELEGLRYSPEARIHRARRRIKKVRSALRLLKAASFPGVSQSDQDLLRDASAELAPPRGAASNIDALNELCAKSGSDGLRFSNTFALLDKQKNAVSPAVADSMRRAVVLLKASVSRIEAWDERPIVWKEVGRALKYFYKRARVAFRKAADDSSTENLHQWRKCAKDLFHALKLIQAANPVAVRRLSRDANKLGELLGADHDLAVLQETLNEFSIGREMPVLGKLIAARRRKLQCKALKLGAKYFSRKAGAFVGKIDG